MDQMVRCYSTKRMTRRWPVAVFYNMIDVSALNAFILWIYVCGADATPKKRKRRSFLIRLAKRKCVK